MGPWPASLMPGTPSEDCRSESDGESTLFRPRRAQLRSKEWPLFTGVFKHFLSFSQYVFSARLLLVQRPPGEDLGGGFSKDCASFSSRLSRPSKPDLVLSRNPLAMASAVDANGATNVWTGRVARDGRFWIDGVWVADGTDLLTITATDVASRPILGQ